MTRVSDHTSSEARKRHGEEAEKRFEREWMCHCGGRFVRSDSYAGMPDFRCTYCGQFIDVKSIDMRHLSISQRPFDGYPDDLIVAVLASRNSWLAAVVGRLRDHKSGPFPAAHSEKPTNYYRFPSSLFGELAHLLRYNYAAYLPQPRLLP